jgi:hypothetical protein
MDRGEEFAAEVSAALDNKFGIKRKLITTRNPQSNSIIKCTHQVVGDMIQTRDIRDKSDLDPDFLWQGVLSAVRGAVHSLVHTITRATPTQLLVFGRDALLTAQHLLRGRLAVHQRTKTTSYPTTKQQRENATQRPHTYKANNKAMVRLDPHHKLLGAKFDSPYAATQVFDNGTIQLSKTTNVEAVLQTWNKHNIVPCEA